MEPYPPPPPPRLTRKKDILYPFLFLYPAKIFYYNFFLSRKLFRPWQKREKKSMRKKIRKEIETKLSGRNVRQIIFQEWMIESVERMGRRCEDRKVIPFVPKFIIRLVYSVVGTRRRGVVATRRSSIEPH